jgi:hypothetical protein
VRSAHQHRDSEALSYLGGAGEGLAVIGRKEGGDAHEVRLFASHILCNRFKRSTEMVVVKERGEGTCVGMLEVLTEVGKLGGQRNGFASVPLVIVSDHDLDVGQKLSGRPLEHAKPKRLKANACVVKVLNRRLDQDNFHRLPSNMKSGETQDFLTWDTGRPPG